MFEKYAKPFFRAGATVLEIGPDATPSTYQRIVADPTISWKTTELASSTTEGHVPFSGADTSKFDFVMHNEYELPLPDESVDYVVSGNVIEHVRRPWDWMPELARVCRRGGYVVTVSPLSWPYHEAPVDAWRIYPEGMRALSEAAGLEVELSEFGTLEPAARQRHYPGQTFDFGSEMRPVTRFKFGIKRLLTWPIPAAYDTVTVARRPLTG
jgi:SAM-dependent methyltransferase